MSASDSTWSYTVVQTPGINRDLPDFYHLHCSPQGELLMVEKLVGKSFIIWAEDACSGQSAQPAPWEVDEADSLMQVQLDPTHYTAAYRLPSGAPQVPPTLASTHQALQKNDGSWWFLPKTDSSVTKARQSSSTVAGENVKPAEKSPYFETPQELALRCQPKEPPAVVKQAEVMQEEQVVNQPEAHKEPAETKQKPKGVKKTKEAKVPNPNSGNSGNSGDSGNSKTDYGNPDIMDVLESAIHDYLVCSDHQGVILALWILHTYTYKANYLTPYLNISSPVEESGKSTCMTILRAFCACPWWAAGVSSAAFKRKLTAGQSTILLDNWHTIFRGTDKQQLTGFLLSGCDLARDFGSLQPDSQGVPAPDGLETFCPKAFAGLESLPPTLARRAIPIVLQRRKPQEVVKSAIHLLTPYSTHNLTSWMQSWTNDQARLDQISNAFEEYESEKHTLPGFTPHQQDISRVLIALADVVGGHWPQKAHAALLQIFREQHDREATPIHLLSDIRDAFAHHGNQERIFTAEVLDYLHSLDHRIWHEWNKNGDPMTAHALSRLLRKSFNIYSRSQRREKDKRRGYQQSDFIEIWERYLPDPNLHPTQENQVLSQCHSSNKEAIEDNAVAAIVEDKVRNIAAESTTKQRGRNQAKPSKKFPNISLSPNKTSPCLNVPVQNSKLEITSYKLRIPPISQFKSDCQKAWTKSTSLMKQLTAKASGMFTTTRS
ncbi:MAG TPA: DUF3631 domain-containing protein [Candidatus Angelobacter sp.]|nr:DUF3631 domain-containing protein [Candidatus Angelobacter sp.]